MKKWTFVESILVTVLCHCMERAYFNHQDNFDDKVSNLIYACMLRSDESSTSLIWCYHLCLHATRLRIMYPFGSVSLFMFVCNAFANHLYL